MKNPQSCWLEEAEDENQHNHTYWKVVREVSESQKPKNRDSKSQNLVSTLLNICLIPEPYLCETNSMWPIEEILMATHHRRNRSWSLNLAKLTAWEKVNILQKNMTELRASTTYQLQCSEYNSKLLNIQKRKSRKYDQEKRQLKETNHKMSQMLNEQADFKAVISLCSKGQSKYLCSK